MTLTMTSRGPAALLAGSLLFLCFASGGTSTERITFATPSPSATPNGRPTAGPLPDIVAASDSASEGLKDIQSELSSNKTVDSITREHCRHDKEIDARELETRRILRRRAAGNVR